MFKIGHNFRYIFPFTVTATFFSKTACYVMATTNKDITPKIWEIDGYIRRIAIEIYPQIIPGGINDIIYTFYDPVCLHSHHDMT